MNARPVTRRPGLRLLGILVLGLVVLLPVVAEYGAVRADNPRLDEQTYWRWWPPITALPWGLLWGYESSTAVPIATIGLIAVGAVSLALGSNSTRRSGREGRSPVGVPHQMPAARHALPAGLNTSVKIASLAPLRPCHSVTVRRARKLHLRTPMPLRPVSDGTPHRVRILVVDDEPAVRSSLRRQLEGAGYDVVEASDGRCVVATVVREGVALVVTDVVMPHHDGMETIQELRRACPTIPVIAISARGQDYLDVARAFGACYAFAKPFESELFVQTVTKVISTLNAA